MNRYFFYLFILALMLPPAASQTVEIVDIRHYPDKVGPGNELTVEADIRTGRPLQNVTVDLPGETVEMRQVSGGKVSTWRAVWTVEGTEPVEYTSKVVAETERGGTLKTFNWIDPSDTKKSCSGNGGGSTSVSFDNYVSSGCTVSSANLDVDVAGDIWDGSYEDISVYVDGDRVASDPTGSDDRDIWYCYPGSGKYTGAFDGDVTSEASDKELDVSTSGSSSSEYVSLKASFSWSESCNSPPNKPGNPDPSSGSSVNSKSPRLSVDVSDPDNDQLDVRFYQGASSGKWEFTTCGSSGRTGPSQSQCDSAYSDTSLAGQVNVEGSGIQEWTVPRDGVYRIKAAGSEGSGSYIMPGTIVQGEFSLDSGTTLQILVGQKGSDSGGGGGTYIARGTSYSSATPLLVAGGGTGGDSGSDSSARGATSTYGKDSSAGPNGGNDGEGGSSGDGGGGGGFYTNGDDGYGPGGEAFRNGGVGAINDNSIGGFGGGGAAESYGDEQGGAGGYSGGAGGDDGGNEEAGGGGSFIDSSASSAATSNGNFDDNSYRDNGYSGSVSDLNNWNSGQGYVTIEYVSPSSSGCRSGWTEYNGHCYRESPSTTSWTSARSYCQNRNAHLVTVNSGSENDFIHNTWGGDHWLGYNDRANEGVWTWTSGSSSYTNWNSNEPNNAGGDEDCGEMRGPGNWNDLSCGNTAQNTAICERVSGGESTIGETGTRSNMGDGHWYSASLSESYSTTPYIFATTQTTYGGQDPSSAHLRGITSSGFEIQHCEFDGGDGCDTHNQETLGYLAVDPSALSQVDGMEAGDFQTTSGSGGYSVSFGQMSSTPLLFTQSQTSDGAPTRNTQAYSISSTGATVEFCEQDSTDGCQDHTSERVAWLAIDPSKIDKREGLDYGTFTTGDSNWQSVSFSQSFSQTPVVIADVQSEDGGQEALYPEVDHVDTDGASIRFCESEGDDSCDSHATETVAWLALEPGALNLGTEKPSGSLIGTDTVSGSGTATTEWEALTCGNSYTWSAVVDDGEASVSGGSWNFRINCEKKPNEPRNLRPSSSGTRRTPEISALYTDPNGGTGTLHFETSSGSSIGSCSTSDGSRCSVEYSSADQWGQTYSYRVWAEDPTGKTSGKVSTSFTTNYKPSVSNLRPTGSGIAVDPVLKADVSDGDGGDTLNVDFINSANSQVIGSDTLTGGGTATLDTSGKAFGSSTGTGYSFRVEVSDGITSSSASQSFTTNYKPRIDSFAVVDRTEGHSFTVDSMVSDPDGENDLDFCRVRISDGDGNTDTRTISDPSGGSGPQDAECDFGPIRYTDLSGWDHNEKMDIRFTVRDKDGQQKTRNREMRFPNHDPEIDSVSFQNYDDRQAFEISSIIKFPDDGSEEARSCEIQISDGSTTYSAGEMQKINQDTFRCVEENVGRSKYPGISVNEELEIKVQGTDIHGAQTSTIRPYNTPTGIKYSYTSVIMQSAAVEFIDFVVSNDADTESTFNLSISGVNASFTDSGTDSTELQVEGGKSVLKEIKIDPTASAPATEQLKITSTNMDTGINKTSKIDVRIRQTGKTTTTNEIPGIGLIHLVTILVISSLIYSRRINSP